MAQRRSAIPYPPLDRTTPHPRKIPPSPPHLEHTTTRLDSACKASGRHPGTNRSPRETYTSRVYACESALSLSLSSSYRRSDGPEESSTQASTPGGTRNTERERERGRAARSCRLHRFAPPGKTPNTRGIAGTSELCGIREPKAVKDFVDSGSLCVQARRVNRLVGRVSSGYGEVLIFEGVDVLI